jgi:hypothetical protein
MPEVVLDEPTKSFFASNLASWQWKLARSLGLGDVGQWDVADALMRALLVIQLGNRRPPQSMCGRFAIPLTPGTAGQSPS